MYKGSGVGVYMVDGADWGREDKREGAQPNPAGPGRPG